MDAKIELAYFPIIGRGQQILILCAEHSIEVKFLIAKPFGDEFDKDTQSPFGTIPWMKDSSNGLTLNDSIAIIQYLVNRYDDQLGLALK
jgi:Glutathione S-transferase